MLNLCSSPLGQPGYYSLPPGSTWQGRLNKWDGLKGKHADFCAIAVYCENQVLPECSKVLQLYCSCGMLANAAMRAFLLHTRLRLWFRIEGIQ